MYFTTRRKESKQLKTLIANIRELNLFHGRSW